MPYATIAADVHEALDVHLDFRPEVAFHLKFSADDFTDLGCLVVSPLIYLECTVNARLIQYLC